MNEDQKKAMKEAFRKASEPEEEYPEWTEEELLATAKVIAKKMGLTERFYDGR